MTCSLYDIKISITLVAPYLIHGNDPGRFGLDATLLKDHKGQAVLPGTLVAGRIAEAWQTYGKEFAGADADTWFGKETDGEQHRARLMVSDLTLQAHQQYASEITRIQLDEDTGSVKQGAMLVVEQIAQPGEKLEFVGSWQVWAHSNEIATLSSQIHAALAMQTQWGAYRSIGFGRMHNCKVNYQEAPRLSLSGFPKDLSKQPQIRLGLRFDVPICVNSKSRRGNVFISGEVIPGNTILGALAQTLLHKHQVNQLSAINGSKLASHFNKLRCTHALPAKPDGGRPIPLPQSLVSISEGLGQLAIKDAFLHNKPPEMDTAPAFQTDWKGQAFDIATEKQGWFKPQRYLRVRTAMQDGKAEDSSLFAYECIHSDAVWLCDLDLTAVPAPDRVAVAKEIEDIMGFGLAPIGKTDARAKVQVFAERKTVWAANLEAIKPNAIVNLVLNTDAVLFATKEIADKAEVDLVKIYRQAFEALDKENAIELSHFFATQRLTGGNYLFKRYLQNKTKTYQPLVLTEAGSVFVFKIKDAAKAEALLSQWCSQGLPLTPMVIENHGASWSEHPYIPQNGYGEVTVNPSMPFEKIAK
jgi:hypothetical protein